MIEYRDDPITSNLVLGIERNMTFERDDDDDDDFDEDEEELEEDAEEEEEG